MNTRELRIGNYVDIINRSGEVHLPMSISISVFEVGIFEVQLCEQPFYRNKHNTFQSKDICEIELTEQWLKKLGFKKNSFSLVWENKRIGVFDCEILKIANCDIEFPIKYVHQLQNLFYFIEGEELTISS